jgi:hypothetical protein
MADAPRERFERAITLGKLTLLRLRAETLLDYADEGKIAVTPEERDELERISIAAKPRDRVFLGDFDDRLAATAVGEPAGA